MPKLSKVRITEKIVLSAKPRNKTYDIRDANLRGFILKVHPSGQKSFYAEWDRGKRTRLADAKLITLERARKIAEQKIAGAKRGEIPHPQIRNSIPKLKGFVDLQYEDWAVAHQKAGASNVQRIRGAFPDFMDTRLDQLTAFSFEQWKVARKKQGIAPATINRDLTMMRAALNKAVEWGETPENPLDRVKQLKNADNKRVRYLKPEEETRLMGALDSREEEIRRRRQSGNNWRTDRGHTPLSNIGPDEFADYLKPMVLLAMNTGLRYGEMSQMRWCDVSLGAKPGVCVKAAHAKTNKTRHIPLNPTGTAVLRTWKKQQANIGEYVFCHKNGGRIKKLESSWGNVLKKAKLAEFTWHDLRHNFASRLVMVGVDLNTVRELLGHGSLTMTLRYAHLSPDKMASAVALLETA